MKSTIGRLTAGIGYGFLFGAGAGLTAGVVAHRLFFWTIIGVIAGVAIGISVALILAAGNRRMNSRFEPSADTGGEDPADKLEP